MLAGSQRSGLKVTTPKVCGYSRPPFGLGCQWRLLRRVWDAIDGEVVGPWWEMTLWKVWTPNGSPVDLELGASRQWGRGLTKA